MQYKSSKCIENKCASVFKCKEVHSVIFSFIINNYKSKQISNQLKTWINSTNSAHWAFMNQTNKFKLVTFSFVSLVYNKIKRQHSWQKPLLNATLCVIFYFFLFRKTNLLRTVLRFTPLFCYIRNYNTTCVS